MQIKLTDTTAYDGDWEFNPDLTMGEYHRVYMLTGVAGGDMWEAIEHGNVGVICALAAVALEQNGKHVEFQLLLNSRSVPEIIGDEQEADADPPPQPTATFSVSGG